MGQMRRRCFFAASLRFCIEWVSPRGPLEVIPPRLSVRPLVFLLRLDLGPVLPLEDPEVDAPGSVRHGRRRALCRQGLRVGSGIRVELF